MKVSTCLRIAAIFGFLAVALGAFGAHGLEDILTEKGADIWDTAVFYHFVHTLAILFLASQVSVDKGSVSKGPVLSFTIGTLVFSGSLYVLALTNIKWLGAITPIGGVAFMVGWLWLFLGTFSKSPAT